MDGLPPLIDRHSHGAVHGELGLGPFETHLATAFVSGAAHCDRHAPGAGEVRRAADRRLRGRRP
ncbi:hypothetical protein ACFW81_09370 [Streptomyces angustmyceticus]|uniref:hypothetical protein n=1 Tax=Streptomyces angustmyceticus TaxID=285578 RepID=UPI0036C04306